MELHALSATELLAAMDRGELTSEAIVTALIARRQAIDPSVNAFVLSRPEALEEARAADRARRTGQPLGPLHGLPITIKDNVDVAGTDSTLGLRARRGRAAQRDAVVVAELRSTGAIILGKTNVPQLLLAQETENAVFGVTNNPWNLERVPGGSSGGEAAAIAAGMSPLGIGTDIGGSIRMPAHFCGIAGFKPTVDRWSNRGCATAIAGQEVVRAQIGPMARCVDDLLLAWRAVDPRRMHRCDPRVAPLPAGEPVDIDLRGRKIGFVADDAFLQPAPALRRAVAEACEYLVAAGAELVPYQPTPSDEIVFLWLAALTGDSGESIDLALAGEDISPQLRPMRLLLKMPALARRAASVVMLRLGQERLARLLEVVGEKTVAELWRLTARRTELRERELDNWRHAGLDAVVCPPHVTAALGHRQSGDLAVSLAAQFRWALLDFPAGVVPVTRVRAAEAGGPVRTSGDRIERKLDAIDAASAGLPVGVQIVARPFDDELALAVMRAVETRARAAGEAPRTPVDPPPRRSRQGGSSGAVIARRLDHAR